jgi:hypothetical protein
MKKSILFFVIINTVLFYSQTVRINVNSVIDNKISLTISSTKKIILDDKLLYANDWIYQVNTLGIAKNQLTLFLYDNENKLVESGVASRLIGKMDIPPEEYDRLKRINDEKNSESKIFILSNQQKKMDLDFRVFDDVEDVFKIDPCTMLGCWYDFYTLKKGEKYKLQILLKLKSKTYKSNMIDFIY